MKRLLLLVLSCMPLMAFSQINFGEAPTMQEESKTPAYDGKYNIPFEVPEKLKPLLGEKTTYIGMNDKTKFYTRKPSKNEERWL